MSTCRFLATAAACFVVGCADFRAYCDTQLIASRNNYLARNAWVDRGSGLCEGREHHNHFQKGFYGGYYNVAAGDGGIAPLVPPEEYWTSGYQDAAGQEMINEWYAGFNEGAFAASQDGVGQLAELPTWVGGQCCDDKGRIMARTETGPRKPRRGDPPVRATLPPPAPKIDLPKNSEGAKERPIDPLIETPPPSDPEKMDRVPIDPGAPDSKPMPKESGRDKEPPKKNMVRRPRAELRRAPVVERKTEMASPPLVERKAEKLSAPVVEEKPEVRIPTTLTSDRWTKRVPPKSAPVTPAKSAVESSKTTLESATATTKSAMAPPRQSEALIPVNPNFLPKAPPKYPVAPPVLPSVGMKAPPVLEESEPQTTSTSEERDLEPPPPAPARLPERLEARSSRTPAKSGISPTSYLRDLPAREHPTPGSDDRREADEWNTPTPPKPSVEDGWGTLHDKPGIGRAAKTAERK
jgi:hypothetical protein